jgi:hypothetical protein
MIEERSRRFSRKKLAVSIIIMTRKTEKNNSIQPTKSTKSFPKHKERAAATTIFLIKKLMEGGGQTI